jgi:hypothetical protein
MKLTTEIITEQALKECRDPMRELTAQLHLKTKLFEACVWYPHLKVQINRSRKKGMSGTLPCGILVRTYCLAGRCIITMARGEHELTLITADDEDPWRRDMASTCPDMGPMGIQSVQTPDGWGLLTMLYEAIRYGAGLELQDDPAVSVA